MNGFQLLEQIGSVVWGPLTMGLTLGIGGYLTIRSRGFQFRRFGTVLRRTIGSVFRPAKRTDGITPFMAMSAALGATMGTGNIVGAATAVTAGGPGAVVWMWLAALVGMMTKFAEVSLAVRERRRGAGPMGYLKSIPGVGGGLAALFALTCAAAALGMGNMTQSNSVSEALGGSFGVPAFLTAGAIGVLTLWGTSRGIGGVMRLSAVVVPVITIAYTAASIAAIWQGRALLPDAFGMMFGQAFGVQAAAGGALGYTVRSAMRFGVARGLFSNEAGLGSAPIAHAEAETNSPVEQGMWGIFEVFVDTILSCTLTALVLLTAGDGTLWQNGETGAKLAAICFSAALGESWGRWVSVFIALFGLTSIFGWCAYGEKAAAFLLRKNADSVGWFRVLYAAGAAAGAVFTAEGVWLLSDVLAGCMMLVNLTGLLLLAPCALDLIADYERWERRSRLRSRPGGDRIGTGRA